MNPYLINNTPAASFFNTAGGSGGGSSDVSANVVTTDNFAQTMQQNLVIREILKDEDDVPASLTNFTTRFNIRENTEQVLVNGVLQAYGPTKDYTISGSDTVVFTENVENGDLIVITYIKG
jgi:hypothetical protein